MKLQSHSRCVRCLTVVRNLRKHILRERCERMELLRLRE